MKERTQYTGMSDQNGKRLYAGDYVIKRWGFINTELYGNTETYRTHVIVRDERSGLIKFNLGIFANSWSGDSVRRITKTEFERMDITLDAEFIYDKNGNIVAL